MTNEKVALEDIRNQQNYITEIIKENGLKVANALGNVFDKIEENVDEQMIIGGNNGSGKTTRLLVVSHKRQLPILCSNRHTKKAILESAKELELQIPDPIAVEELGSSVDQFEEILIDDLESVLTVLIGKRVPAMTTRSSLVNMYKSNCLVDKEKNIVPAAEMVRALGISAREFQELIKKNVVVKVESGMYDLTASMKNLGEYLLANDEEFKTGKREPEKILNTEDGHILVYSHSQKAFSGKEVQKIMTAADEIGMSVVVQPVCIKTFDLANRPKPRYKVHLYSTKEDKLS